MLKCVWKEPEPPEKACFDAWMDQPTDEHTLQGERDANRSQQELLSILNTHTHTD